MLDINHSKCLDIHNYIDLTDKDLLNLVNLNDVEIILKSKIFYIYDSIIESEIEINNINSLKSFQKLISASLIHEIIHEYEVLHYICKSLNNHISYNRQTMSSSDIKQRINEKLTNSIFDRHQIEAFVDPQAQEALISMQNISKSDLYYKNQYMITKLILKGLLKNHNFDYNEDLSTKIPEEIRKTI